MGEEMDSPRGRIFLMKEVLEGRMDPKTAEPFIDNCLGCQACVTSCPSGVQYGELITPYRAWSEPNRKRRLFDRLRRRVLLSTLPYPGRFRATINLARWMRPLRHYLPKGLAGMLDMVPTDRSPKEPLDGLYPAVGKRKARVGLLAGCAQQVLSPGINHAAIRVLNRNGVEVVAPANQACCGALAMHIGAEAEAKATARKNLTAFPDDLDAVITTAAGCGSGMREYGLLFRDEPEEQKATVLAKKTRDICIFLDTVGFTPPVNTAGEGRIVAYHDACHLAHAQGVRDAPRRLLESVKGLTLREPIEGEICCGSAGTYNIEHPKTARILGRRKAENLAATGAEIIATGNIGCLVQVAKYLAETGTPLPVMHTIELLDSKS